MLSVSVYFPIFIIYIFVISCDGRMIEVQRDLPVVKDTSSIDRYWKDVMAFNKTKPLLTKYLQGNLGPKLVSSALSNALSSKVMSDNGAKNGNPSARSLDFRRTPEQGNSVGQILTFSRRRGEGFGDFGSSGQERFWTGGFNAGEVAGADGGERGGMVHFRGQGATLDGAVAGGRARGQNVGRAGGGVGAAKAAAGAASGAGTAAEDGIKSQSSANSQAASQSSKGKSQAMAASSANSQAANGDSAAVSNSQSMAASSSDTANSQSQAMSASMSAANGQSSSSQSAAFAAASSAALGQAMAPSQAMSSSASFSAGSQAMSASSSQSAAIGGANNNAFSSSSSMSMASSNLEGAEAGNNEFKMNFRTPFGTTNVEEKMKIPIMTWKEQFSRWSRKKLNKKRLIQF